MSTTPAPGTSTFMGMAVPIVGNPTITQETVAKDILTLQGAAASTGCWLALLGTSDVPGAAGAYILIKSSASTVAATSLIEIVDEVPPTYFLTVAASTAAGFVDAQASDMTNSFRLAVKIGSTVRYIFLYAAS